MKQLPKISIVMASFNSEKVIKKSLQSLANQNYPKEKVEILVYDGGSTDSTKEIAESFGACVRDNPETEPVAAKLKGYQEATGDLLMYVDTDEIHLNENALMERAELFTDHPEIQIAFSTGYSNPVGLPFINRYINSFGDPFSQFIYRISKESCDSIQEFSKHLHIEDSTDDYVIFDLSKKTRDVLFENAAMGSTIRLGWFKQNYPHLLESRIGPVHMFYHMMEKTSQFSIFKNQPIEHYSADNLSSYLRKIKWRIINNIFLVEKMGVTGFSGRKNLSSSWISKYKKYFYLPYVFLGVPLLLDSLSISFKKKDLRFLIHFPLSVYTAVLIAFYFLLKTSGFSKGLSAYGTNTPIENSTNKAG